MKNNCQNGHSHQWRWWSKVKEERYCAACGVRRTKVAESLGAGLHKKNAFARYLSDLSIGRVESLAVMAEVYQISRPTALRWRHRALASVGEQGSSGLLSGRVEADETFIPSGNQGSRSLGRRARKRGSRRVRGSGAARVRLYTAVERNGEMRGAVMQNAKTREYVRVVQETVAKKSRLLTDGYKSYITAARKAGLSHQRIVSPKRIPLKSYWLSAS